MKSDPSAKKKRPVGADCPFPWKCRHCGKVEVVLATVPYEIDVRHDGELHHLTIPSLELPVCGSCGEMVFTEKVDDQINAVLRAHRGLLTPTEIGESIERLGMTRQEVADRTGIDEQTLSRWIGNVQIQTKAMDNLLRVFFQAPEARVVLSDATSRGA